MSRSRFPLQRGPRVVTEEDKLHWRAAQVLFAELLDDLDGEFVRAGIEYMPIKGAYLIKAGMASSIPFREMDDIDILVREKDFRPAVDHLLKSGKATPREDKWFFEQPFVYKARGVTGRLEVHFLLNRRERFLLETDDLFARSISAGKTCRLPSPEDALLVQLCHVLVHIAWTFRQSVFHDIAQISSQEGFQWDVFWERGARTAVGPFLTLVLHLHRRKTRAGIPVPSLGFYSRILLLLGGLRCCYGLPHILRRLSWEMPFVRSPFKLLSNSLRLRMAPLDRRVRNRLSLF